MPDIWLLYDMQIMHWEKNAIGRRREQYLISLWDIK